MTLCQADAVVGYVATGYLLFVKEGSLYGQAFNADKLSLEGESFLIVDQVAYDGADSMAYASVSPNGVLAYRSEAYESRQLTWLDRTDRQVATVGIPDLYTGFRLSPTSGKIAAVKHNRRTGTEDIWLIDTLNGMESPLTSSRSWYYVSWLANGSELAFSSDQLAGVYDLYCRPLDRSQPERLLYKSGDDKYACDWSRDGRFLLFVDVAAKTQGDLWLFSVENATAKPLVQTSANERQARFSPDGRWLAYVSDESGRDQVYVQAFSESGLTGLSIPVSRDGGTFPVWSRTGEELFFLSSDRAVMSAGMQGDATGPKASDPKRLFHIPDTTGLNNPEFSVSDDGQQFLVGISVPDSRAQLITVALNWIADLRKR